MKILLFKDNHIKSIFKISGISTDLFGYKREVNIRGCPMLSLITRLEEGCTGTGMESKKPRFFFKFIFNFGEECQYEL